MQKKLIFLILVILLAAALLSACGEKPVVEIPETPEPVIETPAPECFYPVLVVKSDSSIETLDEFISLAKEKPLSVYAEDRCRLAAACFEALEDIRFSFSDKENADALVVLPNDVPASYRELGSLELAIWSPESQEQSDTYSAIEQELSEYLN